MAVGRKVKDEMNFRAVLPIFIFTVSVVFSLVFTVLMTYINAVQSDIKMIFIMMLIVSNVTASTVALVFFLFFEKRLK
jgi:uncharacterized Tic20 family protein